MLFYEIKDVERMLATTQDPIADFINCVQADVIAFASQLSYLEFIEKASKLNELNNYPQLTGCAKRMGYEVSKVVFRGYFASEKLQKMHDNAIEKRTQLKIQVSCSRMFETWGKYLLKLSLVALIHLGYSKMESTKRSLDKDSIQSCS